MSKRKTKERTVVVRVSAELHYRLKTLALSMNTTLERLTDDLLRRALDES